MDGLTGLAGGLALLALLSAWTAVWLWRRSQRMLLRLEALEHELERHRQRLVTLESETPLPEPTPVSQQSPYALAIQLAHEGYAPEELALHCGISRGEAELIISLYRTRAR
ncbi:DUF2802 domain-containing protein [Leeia sp.]|uniref:DUF2802 domain-containing protein n=1 Tax=Leeia sp. TaxID=2884678 RepID=UPI0035AE15D0